MKNYKIEGNIDFFSELYKSLDIQENSEKTEQDNHLCLITAQPLQEKFFQMECGHKFNYIPLFLDIKNHKYKFNNMEGSSSRLNHDEIRCPYCRHKQKGVLPYYEEFGLGEIAGVNYINASYKIQKYSTYYNTCQYLTPNPSFDPSGNNVLETHEGNYGNCKFLKCFHMGSQISAYQGLSEMTNYGDDKYYCWKHKKDVIRKYKKEIVDQLKEQSKNEKIKKKLEENKLKALEKQKLKQEKKVLKLQTKLNKKNEVKKTINTNKSDMHQGTQENQENQENQVKYENVVLGPNIFNDSSGNIIEHSNKLCCNEILKTGPKKGQFCGCKIFQNELCKRHYKMKYKDTNEESDAST